MDYYCYWSSSERAYTLYMCMYYSGLAKTCMSECVYSLVPIQKYTKRVDILSLYKNVKGGHYDIHVYLIKDTKCGESTYTDRALTSQPLDYFTPNCYISQTNPLYHYASDITPWGRPPSCTVLAWIYTVCTSHTDRTIDKGYNRKGKVYSSRCTYRKVSKTIMSGAYEFP